MATTVANKHQLDRGYPGWVNDPGYVYIGRKRGEPMHFGNPFSHRSGTLAMLKVASREGAVQAFEAWLLGSEHQEVEPARRQWVLDHIGELRDKVLVCFCHPALCHGDIYAKLLDRWSFA